MFVVYFDQRTGTLHPVRWSKSFVFAWKQVFSYFSVTIFIFVQVLQPQLTSLHWLGHLPILISPACKLALNFILNPAKVNQSSRTFIVLTTHRLTYLCHFSPLKTNNSVQLRTLYNAETFCNYIIAQWFLQFGALNLGLGSSSSRMSLTVRLTRKD